MRASALGLCLTLPVSSHSAKQLVRGEPNVSYICSRYYRAPELIFGATDYTSSIGQLGNRVLAGFKLLGMVAGLVIKTYRLFQHWFSQVEAGAGASCLEQSVRQGKAGCYTATAKGSTAGQGRAEISRLI